MDVGVYSENVGLTVMVNSGVACDSEIERHVIMVEGNGR